nr:GNAT family N-acetyltransferase [uncultured Clostridium sp.]
MLSQKYTGKGIGNICLERLEADAKAMGIHQLIAEISSENNASLKFHKKHGFEVAGELKNIGYKLNTSFGVVYMQKTL